MYFDIFHIILQYKDETSELTMLIVRTPNSSGRNEDYIYPYIKEYFPEADFFSKLVLLKDIRP